MEQDLQTDELDIIRPAKHFASYLALSKKSHLIAADVIKEQLQKELVIWDGIDWVTCHIQRDLKQY